MRSFLHNHFTQQGHQNPITRTLYQYLVRRSFVKPALALLAGLLFTVSVMAQGNVRVTGTVVDENKVTIPGVSVSVKGTTNGTATDLNGKYVINVAANATLVFSAVGYTPKEVAVAGQTVINASLVPTNSSLNEVVVVGYGQQKKVALTGAISQISASDIVTTKNENLLNSLTGKIPGLRVVQNTSEPGSFANNYDIRGLGTALVVVDGIPRPDIARIDPNDVETISVLKDASAAVYGVRAANGVILITTKKGKAGQLELNYGGTYGLQYPVTFGHGVGAVDYMTLVNEKAVHNAGGAVKGNRTYTDAQIAEYMNGTKQSYDWADATVHKNAAQTQHTLSASGGSEKSTYFISMGYTGQDGILKSDALDYRKYNLRSNLTTKVGKNIDFQLQLAGTMDKTNRPLQDPYWVIRSMWYQPPINPIYANDNPAYLYALPNPLHPVAQSTASVSGYKQYQNKFFQSSANITYNVPFVKGLSVKGVYAYDFTFNDNKIYNKAYNLYSYNAVTGIYTGVAQQSPSTVRREVFEYPTNLGQIWLSYAHNFNNVHNVSASLIYEASTRSGDNFEAQREVSIPLDQIFVGNSTNQQGLQSNNAAYAFKYKSAAYIGTAAYDYKSRYFAKFNFRYDGSSKFPTVHQWGFFPAGEAGWRISEEPFFKSIKSLSFISNLKFRGSYGLLGDDQALAYQFTSGYNYPSGGAVFDGVFVNGTSSRGLTNPAIFWTNAKFFDVGGDMEAWNGKLGVSFDYFIRTRTGLLASSLSSLPDVVGASLPQQNLNSDRSEGFDFEVSHRNRVGKFDYNVKGTLGFTRTQWGTYTKTAGGNSYANWINNTNLNGRYNNVYFGYGSDGQFQNYKEIENSPIFVARNTVVGDYRYLDWNGDGQIGSDDSHPIATTGLPMVTFGLNVGGSYKGFDINALFSGAAMVSTSYVEQMKEPLWAGGNAQSQFLDRWHPADPNADPYSPSTVWIPGYYAYTGTLPYTNTSSNTHSAAYLRMKSLEFGYTFPQKWIGRAGIKSLRLFFTGYNLLTITGLKYADPEHPSGISAFNAASNQYDYAYPLDKIYSIGLNMKF